MLALVLVMRTFQHLSAETHLCQGAAVLSVPAFCNCFRQSPTRSHLAIPKANAYSVPCCWCASKSYDILNVKWCSTTNIACVFPKSTRREDSPTAGSSLKMPAAVLNLS